MARYYPRRGDFVIVTFNPQSGHEQKGRRPALVVSKTSFNRRTGFALVCPITNTNRKTPLHVPISTSSSLSGFVMVEQIKSLDYRSRHMTLVEKAPRETLEEVLSILDAVLY